MNETKLRNSMSQLNKKLFTNFPQKDKSGLLSKGSTSSASDESTGSISTTSSPLPSPTDFDNSSSFHTNCPLDLSQKSTRSKSIDNFQPIKSEQEEMDSESEMDKQDEEAESPISNFNNFSSNQISPALIAAASAMIENLQSQKASNSNIPLLSQGLNPINCFSTLFKFMSPNMYLNYLSNLNDSANKSMNPPSSPLFPQLNSTNNLSEMLLKTMKNQQQMTNNNKKNETQKINKKHNEQKNIPSPLNLPNNSLSSSTSSSTSSSSISSPSFPQLNDLNINLLSYFKNNSSDKDSIINSLIGNQSFPSSSSLFLPPSLIGSNAHNFSSDAYSGILSNLQINPSSQISVNTNDSAKAPIINPRGRQPKQKLDETSETEVYVSYNENDEKEIKQVNKRPRIEKDVSPSLSNSNSANSISNTSLNATIPKPKKGPKAKNLDGKSPMEVVGNLRPAIDPMSVKPELLIHGGFGVKNPEYEALNNDINLFESVEILDDPENKYRCKICSKTFKLQRLMNRHMKNHSNVKRYLCTFCQKGFNDAFDLKRHTRTHTGVRPFQCFECDRKFTQRCSLESHLNKVHQVELSFRYKERRAKLYVCEDCGLTTEDPEEHLNHLQKFHPNSPALKRSYDRRIIKIPNNKDGTQNSNSNSNNADVRSSMTNSSTNHSISSSVPSPFNQNESQINEKTIDESQCYEDYSNYENGELDTSVNYEQEANYEHEEKFEEESNTPEKSQRPEGRKKSRKSPKSLIKYKQAETIQDDEEFIEDEPEFKDDLVDEDESEFNAENQF
ncbi:unnamed protein product [Brachionus calyciflorus]|uniref:C2H2-type domain-containing protein n=1 Tax=Brachionus calyciflorus TaxID=104777 RepID=A0A813M1P1_9BILA|nr:unnamed protein product [Brachionus calyciflorus]